MNTNNRNLNWSGPLLRCGLIILIIAGFLLASCKKYLDVKPDKSLEVPATLQDFQAILDFQSFNLNFPYAGDIASDDYFLGNADWKTLPLNSRLTYVWDPQAANDQDWSYGYINVIRCNVVLDGIDQALVSAATLAAKNNVKGIAYFFRGYTFYQLANVFTMPYNQATAGTMPGIPLRLKADITEPTVRSTLEESYRQIISDLKNAAALLSVTPSVKSRPSKPAAYGALARTYLAMQDYTNAGLYADSCLQLYSKLINYSTLDTTLANPFGLYNDEVIFHATSSGRDGVVDPYIARVDSTLYASYTANDLRKRLFYTFADHGHYAFKGDYTGQSYGMLFNGIATDEMLLIRAEASARAGNITAAVGDLNKLLTTRYKKNLYTPYPATLTADATLSLILAERRKELAFRSELRWADLRRLNQDSRFAKTLTRNLNGTIYTLPPNDKRYAFLIPVAVIQISGIQQNAR